MCLMYIDTIGRCNGQLFIHLLIYLYPDYRYCLQIA